MKIYSYIFTILFITLNLQAGFLNNLFHSTDGGENRRIDNMDNLNQIQTPKKRAGTILEDNTQPIVDEEVISAKDYQDSSDEPSDEIFTHDDERQAFDEQEFDDNTGDIESFDGIKSESIFLSYFDKPKRVYIFEHVNLHIKAIIADSDIKEIKSNFLHGKNYKILNPNESWHKIDDKTYENNFIVKLLSKDAKFPDIKVSSVGNKRVRSKILKSLDTNIVALYGDNDFCKVLSRDFTLIDHRQKKYDENSNIVVMEINATGANLEDFHLSFASRDGIDEIKYNGNSERIYYFAIVSNSLKEFKFKYFDLKSNRYNLVSFPMLLQDSTISTQSDLNPEESKYTFYKLLFLLLVAFIFMIIYFKTKKVYFIFLSLVFLAAALYIKKPLSKIVIDKGVKLRILPLKNSTVFFVTDKKIQATKLLDKNGYIKVLLPNKKIGWLKK